jgi:hypothetical protein
MSKLREAIKVAEAADTAFEAAIKAAGYKSRWDWQPFHGKDVGTSEVWLSYCAKVHADNAMMTASFLTSTAGALGRSTQHMENGECRKRED